MHRPVHDDPGREARLSGDVLHWRLTLLAEAGFEPDAARALAAHRGCDLHELLTLVDGGCPPRLAQRILAPL